MNPLDKKAVLSWSFAQTIVEISPAALIGQGGGIFGSSIASEKQPLLPVGTEVRIKPFNRKRRRDIRSLRGIVVGDTAYGSYEVRHHEPGEPVRVWRPSEIEAVPDLELLAEAEGG